MIIIILILTGKRKKQKDRNTKKTIRIIIIKRGKTKITYILIIMNLISTVMGCLGKGPVANLESLKPD